MHHWGCRTLPLESGYSLHAEENNAKDTFAVCIRELADPHHKRGYLCREWGRRLQSLLPHVQKALIKIKGRAVIIRQRRGPEHEASVGFRISDEKLERVTAILKHRCVEYELIKK